MPDTLPMMKSQWVAKKSKIPEEKRPHPQDYFRVCCEDTGPQYQAERSRLEPILRVCPERLGETFVGVRNHSQPLCLHPGKNPSKKTRPHLPGYYTPWARDALKVTPRTAERGIYSAPPTCLRLAGRTEVRASTGACDTHRSFGQLPRSKEIVQRWYPL